MQVQSWLQASNNTGILNTCTQLWLTESEQTNPMDSIKDIVQSSVKVPEFNKHLKKAGRHIRRNVVEITLKMKTIVRKPLMIKNHQASSQKFRELNWENRTIAERQKKTTRFHILAIYQTNLGTESEESQSYYNIAK